MPYSLILNYAKYESVEGELNKIIFGQNFRLFYRPRTTMVP
jgi:hypothetical protein